MADVFSRKKRSYIMSRVKGRGNRLTELRMVELFRAHGFVGWRRNSTVFGRPDFVFPASRIAVFVDGCFWHGCPLHGQVPKTNRAFWKRKLIRNRNRDLAVNRELGKRGWKSIRVWQHDLRAPKKVIRRLARLIERPDRNVSPRS